MLYSLGFIGSIGSRYTMRGQRRTIFLFSMVLILVAVMVLVGSVQAHTTGPHVRIAHLAPDTSNVDVYVNDKMFVGGVKYGAVSKYLPIVGWDLSVVAVPAGGKPAD